MQTDSPSFHTFFLSPFNNDKIYIFLDPYHMIKRLCEIYEEFYAAMQVSASIEATHDALRNSLDIVHSTLMQLEHFVEIEHWDPLIVFLGDQSIESANI